MTKIKFFLNKKHSRKSGRGGVALNSLCVPLPTWKLYKLNGWVYVFSEGKYF